MKKSDSTARKISKDAVFQPEFWEDLRHWVGTDRKVALRTFTLVEAIFRDLVYLVTEDRIDFFQARYHY